MTRATVMRALKPYAEWEDRDPGESDEFWSICKALNLTVVGGTQRELRQAKREAVCLLADDLAEGEDVLDYFNKLWRDGVNTDRAGLVRKCER